MLQFQLFANDLYATSLSEKKLSFFELRLNIDYLPVKQNPPRKI